MSACMYTDRAFADVTCAVAVIVRALSVAYILTSSRKSSSGSPMGSLGSFLESVLSQFSLIRPACSLGRSFMARYSAQLNDSSHYWFPLRL
jgi:hypothetical protein